MNGVEHEKELRSKGETRMANAIITTQLGALFCVRQTLCAKLCATNTAPPQQRRTLCRNSLPLVCRALQGRTLAPLAGFCSNHSEARTLQPKGNSHTGLDSPRWAPKQINYPPARLTAHLTVQTPCGGRAASGRPELCTCSSSRATHSPASPAQRWPE